MWHDPLTNEQHFGLLAMDPADDEASARLLFDSDAAWPAERVTAWTDEAHLHLRIELAGSPPGTLLAGFDVLPAITGPPMALLTYGDWRSADSLALWNRDDDKLDIRVPWAMLGFADPSTRQVGVPAKGLLATQVNPGVTVSLSASGTEQAIGQVTWENWNRPSYTERLKRGAGQFRDAALSLTSG